MKSDDVDFVQRDNIPLYTYPVVAGYLQRGNIATGKGEKSRKRMLKGSIFLKSKKMYYLCTF